MRVCVDKKLLNSFENCVCAWKAGAKIPSRKNEMQSCEIKWWEPRWKPIYKMNIIANTWYARRSLYANQSQESIFFFQVFINFFMPFHLIKVGYTYNINKFALNACERVCSLFWENKAYVTIMRCSKYQRKVCFQLKIKKRRGMYVENVKFTTQIDVIWICLECEMIGYLLEEYFFLEFSIVWAINNT